MALTTLSACTPYADSDQSEINRAEVFLDNVLAGNDTQIERMANPLLAAQTTGQLSMVLDWVGPEVPQFEYLFTLEGQHQLPGEGLVPSRAVVFKAPVENISMTVLEPDHPMRATYLYAEVGFAANDPNQQVIAWAINPANRQLSSVNSFTLSDQPFTHYVFLTLTVLSPIVCIAALILMFIGPKFRLRWLWALGSLLGFGRLTLNWASGDYIFAPLHIQVLGAGFIKPAAFDPVFITFSLPVFALIYLIWKRREVGSMDAETVEIFSG